MSVDWNKEEIKEWLRTCREKQEEYYEFLGRHKWIQYKPTEHDLLKRNIGFAFFGGVGEPDETDEFTGYNKKQSKDINKMFQLIVETKKDHWNKDNNIWASFLFVSCKIHENHVEIPVIRVPKYDISSTTNEDIFIDSSFRVYKNWKDFLDNNKLPNCLMCYPNRGKYFKLSGQLQLDKQVSPKGRIGSKVLKGADITTTVIQCATVGVSIASIFVPMAWPVLMGITRANLAAGGYVAGRSVAELRDRNVHQQSIGLDNAESRNCYLGIVGSAMGIASGGAVAKAVRATQAGESIALSSQIAITSISAASCAVNSLGVANGIANIIQKIMNKEEVTSYDIFQVTSAVLFFTNSVISTRQAMLLRSLDKSNTSNILNVTKRSVRAFTGIGEIVHFENVPGAVGLGCMSATNTASVQRQFFIVSKDICRKLFEIAQLLWRKLILPGEYRKHVGVYLKMLWDSWNEEINMVIEKICHCFGLKYLSPVIMGGCKYLAGENPHVLEEICKIILTEQEKIQSDLKTLREKSTSQHEPSQSSSATEMDVGKYQDVVIEFSKKFADQQQCESPHDFIRYLKFTCKFIRNEFMKQKQDYYKNLEILRKFSPDVTVEEFDRESGIHTNHSQYFLEKVMKDFKTGNGFVMLKIAYEKQKTLTVAEEANETSFLLSDEDNVRIIAIENERGLGTDDWLSRDQYLALARKLIRDEANETNITIEEDVGVAVMIIGEADKIINVATQKKEDNMEIYGIALMLDNSPQACQ